MDNVRVYIDPVDNILYSSYYIYGLESLFGKKHVLMSPDPFKELSSQSRHSWSTRFVIKKDGQCKKYVIHGDDTYQIKEELYDWCDVYGSVNANFKKTSQRYHEKLVALCPSFGIRCWSPFKTVINAFRCFPKGESLMTIKRYFGQHKRLLHRLGYEDYLSPTRELKPYGYVFFLSTLWYNDEWNRNDEGVNLRRANFIRACKHSGKAVFDGGLVSLGKDRSSESVFSDCLCDEVSMKEWLEKTKQSTLVFNTPAFWNCHGWKLGEYLALGKCIVSTQLQNDLPVPLEHGKNIHFVEDSQDSMAEAIGFILSHPEYQRKLENGAKEYWAAFGTPTAALKLLGVGL